MGPDPGPQAGNDLTQTERVVVAFELVVVIAIAVEGKTEPSRIYQRLGLAAETKAGQRMLKVTFATSLVTYRNQDWAKARTAFGKCLEAAGDDRPSRTFLDRIAILEQDPLLEAWDGVQRLATK